MNIWGGPIILGYPIQANIEPTTPFDTDRSDIPPIWRSIKLTCLKTKIDTFKLN